MLVSEVFNPPETSLVITKRLSSEAAWSVLHSVCLLNVTSDCPSRTDWSASSPTLTTFLHIIVASWSASAVCTACGCSFFLGARTVTDSLYSMVSLYCQVHLSTRRPATASRTFRLAANLRDSSCRFDLVQLSQFPCCASSWPRQASFLASSSFNCFFSIGTGWRGRFAVQPLRLVGVCHVARFCSRLTSLVGCSG